MPTDVPSSAEFDALTKRVSNVESQVSRLALQLTKLGAPAAPEPSDRKIVFLDDFAVNTFDKTKWNVRNDTYASNEESIVTARPANIAFDLRDGASSLVLRARKEDYKIPNGATARKYTSAYIDSRGKASFLYGRFEMRAKLPTTPGKSKGMWPAFWLRPDDGGNGEIDIMEAIGSGSAKEINRVHATVHHDYLPGSAHVQAQPTSYVVPSPTTDWHVYALEWTADEMVWFVDNIEIYRRNSQTTPWFREVFNKKYHFRVNLQVGGTWAGSPDENTQWPGDFQIDWIRVFEPLDKS